MRRRSIDPATLANLPAAMPPTGAELVYPPGTRVLVDKRDAAVVKQCFPQGSTSFMHPHCRVRFVGGDDDVAVSLSRLSK